MVLDLRLIKKGCRETIFFFARTFVGAMDVSGKRSAAEFWRKRNRPQRRPARRPAQSTAILYVKDGNPLRKGLQSSEQRTTVPCAKDCDSLRKDPREDIKDRNNRKDKEDKEDKEDRKFRCFHRAFLSSLSSLSILFGEDIELLCQPFFVDIVMLWAISVVVAQSTLRAITFVSARCASLQLTSIAPTPLDDPFILSGVTLYRRLYNRRDSGTSRGDAPRVSTYNKQ
jgi:hypothetical protein